MFQMSGLKHIAAAHTQRDCLEKSTREESGGGEEAMTNENESQGQVCNSLCTTDRPHANANARREDPKAIQYIQNASKEQNGVMSYYEVKLVRSNRWIIEASGKSWTMIPSLMARVL